MSHSALRGALLALVPASVLWASVVSAQQIPYTQRFSANARGDIAAIGNVNQTCPSANATCVAARDHLPPQANVPNLRNNDWVGVGENINVDAAAGYPDTSSAELKIPAGSSILFAGLYWGGQAPGPVEPARPVQLRTPQGANYTQIEPLQTGSVLASAPGYFWGSFADVTQLVRAGGSGNYYVGDLVKFAPGAASVGPLASWSLVVAFSHPGQILRNLAVFDGYQLASGNSQIFAHITDFVTPAVGAFEAKLGVIVHDGDRGQGDSAPELAPFTGACNAASPWTATAGDVLNPASDFYNSTISYLGASGTYGGGARNPSYNNTFGLDIDVVPITLANSITDQCVRIRTGGEGIAPQALFTSIEIFQPAMETDGSKIHRNITRPELTSTARIGDVLEYDITASNVGQDPAVAVVLRDSIPAGATYVPGSLQVLSGANVGAKTDAAGDDQAELAGNDVVFRLGTGANGAAGGQLGQVGSATSTTSVRFRVTVDGAVGSTVVNRASTSFRGLTIAESFSQTTNDDVVTIVAPPEEPDAGSSSSGGSSGGSSGESSSGASSSGESSSGQSSGESSSGQSSSGESSSGQSSSGESSSGSSTSGGTVSSASSSGVITPVDPGADDGDPDLSGGAGCNTGPAGGGGSFFAGAALVGLLVRRRRNRA